MHSPAMQGECLPEASGCNVGPVDGARIGGPAICARRAGSRAGTGDIEGTGPPGRGAAKAVSGPSVCGQADWQRQEHTYAALDLGTNNCRLLIACPAPAGNQDGLQVIDSFSRIVRLGEGLSRTGELSAAAIERTLGALEICREKMHARGVTRRRLIATEACRSASNGAEFLAKVRAATGLELEIVDRETEARLAVAGSASLADSAAEGVILFDIGGGSSELVWLAGAAPTCAQSVDMALAERIRFWVSLKVGVVTLAEEFGGIEVSGAMFKAMTDHAARELEGFVAMAAGERRGRHFHLLGTSGTVTAIAGVFLGLARYDRRRVDGLWMSSRQVDHVVARLRKMTYEERAANGCIGHGRADLVLAGCAILEAIRRAFPADRVRIADRGLREGMLIQLMRADRT
jgi:exopolyphosphatase / guanosine-5'-triphosphate,3'-diphosphate pyrophosphatase